MRKLDLTAILGIAAGFTIIVIAIAANSGLGLYWSLPSILITVGGSFCALLINYDWVKIRKALEMARDVFLYDALDLDELIGTMGHLAKRARREGFLALESELEYIDDDYMRRGVQMIVDTIDPETIRDIMEADIKHSARYLELGERVFKTWAHLAPAFGMIGTIIGLMQMLSRLDDPRKLGPGLALAMLTTFYGSILAYMVFLPVAGKLTLRNEEKVLAKHLTLEGVLSIQMGVNPRILEDKLRTFIPPQTGQRQVSEREGGMISVHQGGKRIHAGG
ncbi:MAG: motility protein A [Bacillota bacterium]